MTLQEVILRTKTEHWLRPFARSAGVLARRKSPRLERVLSDFGIENSFTKANVRLREHYGFGLSATAIRTATLKHAARAEQLLQKQYATSYRALPVCGPAVLLAEIDGSMLCTVAAGRARQGSRPRVWQEVRLAAVRPEGSLQTTFAATFDSVQEIGRRWGHAAKQAGRALGSHLHALGDGAEWIALQTRAVFGRDATLLTDYFHVSQYLAAAAPTCCPNRPDQWRRTQQRRLKTGAVQKILAALANAREAPQTPEEQAPVRAAHRYLSNRLDTLDYPAALRANLPIGSGLIESGHKHVLQARLKLPGAAWLPANAEKIAQLRVLRSNDQWALLWPKAA